MREICTYGSEGGVAFGLSLPLSEWDRDKSLCYRVVQLTFVVARLIVRS